jgi:pimeloyl-ACP methyl ester carboxylesterase
MEYPTSYRSTKVDGFSIFYRKAGPKNAPTLLLLHGFPSSSRMFEPLFARPSSRYHLVAPDYPGFGHSEWPDPKKCPYTFDHIAEIMDHFTEVRGLSRYTLDMQDYGGPVGFRMVLAHPERVERLIVQDAVAHNSGWGRSGNRGGPSGRIDPGPRARFAQASSRRRQRDFATSGRTRIRTDTTLISGRTSSRFWTSQGRRTSRPISSSTIAQTWMPIPSGRTGCPGAAELAVIWGKYESPFDSSEPDAYRRDVPAAHVRIVDGGHFALDTAADDIAALVRDFMDRRK